MPPEPLEALATQAFRSQFTANPSVLAKAPSRVELLGNHTDYNGGLVLAAAIDRFTVVAAKVTSEDALARFRSVNFGESEVFDPAQLHPDNPGTWGRYVRGVVWALQEAFGKVKTGFQGAIVGDVPLGAGLSSSASLQASLALAAIGMGLFQGQTTALDDPARMRLAKILRRSENDFVGVASGLLDQFAVLFGREAHALSLDCRSLGFERLPLGNPAPAILVCDTKTSRRLADGMYNQRRAECERVVAHFQKLRGKDAVAWLRDIGLDDLESAWPGLDPVGRLRARHVLTENERVAQGAEALKQGDLKRFGRLMSESHASSRDDFANSSTALDALVEASEATSGYLGGKLSGAGWAGCVVALVEPQKVEAFAEEVRTRYARSMGVTPEIHLCKAAEGAFAKPSDPSTDSSLIR